MEGVVAVLTAADIPGQNCIEPPIVPCLRVPALADKKVQFAGQPVAIVVAGLEFFYLKYISHSPS